MVHKSAQVLPLYRVTFEGLPAHVIVPVPTTVTSAQEFLEKVKNATLVPPPIAAPSAAPAASPPSGASSGKRSRSARDEAAWERALARAVEAPDLESAQAVMDKAEARLERKAAKKSEKK